MVPVADVGARCGCDHALQAQRRVGLGDMLHRGVLQREEGFVLHRIGDLQHEFAGRSVDEEVLVALAHQFLEAARDAVVALQQALRLVRGEGGLGGVEDGNLVHGIILGRGATSPRSLSRHRR